MALTTVHVAQREPVLGGRPFGDAGAYEKVAGALRFAVDPTHPLHAEITDLDRAPRNGAGLVEFAADFYLLRPREGARGNGALLLDVPNRGRKVALGMFNSTPRAADPTTEEDFGNGFLMRHGYTVAWVGWQSDVPRVELRVPLGTFTGWNPRHPDQGAPGDIMAMIGSTLPFCRTADERAQRGDPRASVAERYASRDEYLVRVRAACTELVALRHMLAEDVEAVVARAGRQYDLFRTLA